MKQQAGFFKVEEVAKQPIAQAVKALMEDAEVDAATKDSIKDLNWNKLPFVWFEAETKEEALQGISDADLLETLNGIRKANAKSKEYQRVTKPFRPDPNDPEVKRASMIKDFVTKFNVDEATATTTVDALIASGKANPAA